MFERYTEQARQVVVLIGVGTAEQGGAIPFTPAAKDALEATLRESLELGHDRVEPGHLLLGVLRQRDSVARRVLSAAGAHPPDARAEIVRRLEQSGFPHHVESH